MDGEQVFTIIHPFHPLSGQQFPLIAQRKNWGEPRVQFCDPRTGLFRSIPRSWTDLAPLDPFIQLAVGRATLRLSDLQALAQFLSAIAMVHQDET